jgi:ElaB/YqjD/DUF883 family membrane-anchored ribosome-binding protein
MAPAREGVDPGKYLGKIFVTPRMGTALARQAMRTERKMQVSTGKLIKDLRAVIVDTEDLLKATAGQTGELIEKVRARAEESLRAASHDVQATAQDAMHKVDRQMRANPWTAVGIAAAIGFVAGILLGRKRAARLRLVERPGGN